MLFRSCTEIQGGGDQLGLRRGKDADLSPVGLMAEALRQSGAADMVPRDLQAGRHAVQAGRSGPDSQADRRTGSGGCWTLKDRLQRTGSRSALPSVARGGFVRG